jgi:DNA replication regulator SLD3
MSTYALQTKTMPQRASDGAIQLLGVPANRDESKPQLPSKQRREAICGLGTSYRPFTIKPHPGSPYQKPASFKPVRVIGRSQLPLTFLDITADDSFAANSLFSAHIDVLENEDGSPEAGNDMPRVLIARYDNTRTLYAIERVQAQVYSICKLAGWLKEKDVAELWDPASLQACSVVSGLDMRTVETGDWWQHARVQAMPIQQPARQMRMTMMRKTTGLELMQEPAMRRFDSPAIYEPHTTNSIPTSVQEDQFSPPLPQEQLESLVQQYLDAVYMSKTSLAYFAKGPIARIRNTFTAPEEGAPSTHELVTFLRSMLLSPKASEKKYYEKLPTIIHALPPGSFSDEELGTGAIKLKKTKKKLKLSREGVYAHEEAIVKRWWNSDTPSGEETVEQRIKRRIGDLRVRETLAQLIIMLEVIALEALSTYKPPPRDDPALDVSQPQDDSQAKPKKRKRKLDDIGLQLDLLLDKLCIWHATEEAGIIDFDTKPTQRYDNVAGLGNGGASDRLRDFSIEVVIPFYMNRLPEQALMINKKLGGPAHTSPPKRKALQSSTTSRKSGEPREPDAKKSRRSLARVATETMRRSTDRVTPSLSRSMTDSALIRDIKREGSEAPLSAVPFQRSPSKNNRRSMSQYRHLEGRELDLTTPSAAVTAKLKQKQRVEEDLKEAITALKKPNRGLAASGYVDEVEGRGVGPSSRSRKQLNPTRKVVKDIQVTATPRVGRRTKDMVEQTPSHHSHVSNPFARLSTAMTSPSGFRIPSSGSRQPALVPGTVHRSATGRHLVHHNIAETPSKAPNAKVFDAGTARRTIFATPSKTNVNATTDEDVFETPAKAINNAQPAFTNMPPAAVFATPTKPTSIPRTEATSGAGSGNAQTEESSIYAALGWDDDDDDLV